jgi:hypothetical protein
VSQIQVGDYAACAVRTAGIDYFADTPILITLGVNSVIKGLVFFWPYRDNALPFLLFAEMA